MPAPQKNQNARKYTGVLSSVSFRIPRDKKAGWVKQAQASKHKKLTAWLINRIDGLTLHAFDDLPDKPIGALIVELPTDKNGYEPMIVGVNDYSPSDGWDKQLKSDQTWIDEDDLIDLLFNR
jgi:hypothetical protein